MTSPLYLSSLQKFSSRMIPRLLTQACRDTTSPFYGCFDRNWWHYKIRDFPSIILQQGGYALYLASKLPEWRPEADALTRLARASCVFWNQRAVSKNAFEEYYPWEQGYPPLAFSTLAVLKLHMEGVVEAEAIRQGVTVAAGQLLTRFEEQAANQQVAGLAALAAIRKAFPAEVPEQDYREIRDRSLALQHEEGWYTEYDGPDLGYLTVTMDCLWDLYDFTGEEVYLRSAEKAVDFIAAFVGEGKIGAGMHNARNTDYLVPYGLSRFAQTAHRETVLRLLHALYANADAPGHFFTAVDDRYISHYIGHSILRTLVGPAPEMPPAVPAPSDSLHYFPGSGHVLRSAASASCGVLLSLRKGGILQLYTNDGRFVCDYGWIATTPKRQFVSHWWSKAWHVGRQSENKFAVTGTLFPHCEQTSTPWKHVVLRIGSFLMGRHLIRQLKKMVIFKKVASSAQYSRILEISAHGATVEDRFRGLPADARLEAAPRASKRHVASADSFHRQDLTLAHGFSIRQDRSQEGVTLIIRTTFRLDEEPRTATLSPHLP